MVLCSVLQVLWQKPCSRRGGMFLMSERFWCEWFRILLTGLTFRKPLCVVQCEVSLVIMLSTYR